jgi:hypothetical protein
MKLNLLPQTVRVGAKAKTAWIGAILMVAVGMAAAVMMSIQADQADKESADALAAVQPQAQKAYDTASAADAILASDPAKEVVLNANLANAMIKHNGDFPTMYEELFRYNPPFFRLTSISATPVSATQASITMTGTITTYQQYADLVLALLRNKKVRSVARSGFNYSDLQVPPLVPADQVGRPRKPGEAPIPDDPLLRLTYFESQPQPTGYNGGGNFGSGTPAEREAMPGESLITITMTADYALQTPSPMQTLSSLGGGSLTPSGTAAGPGSAPGPSGAASGNQPLAPANLPSAPPTSGAAKGGAAKNQGGD